MADEKVRWVTIRVPLAELPGPALTGAAMHWVMPAWTRELLAQVLAGLVAEGLLPADAQYRQRAIMWIMEELRKSKQSPPERNAANEPAARKRP